MLIPLDYYRILGLPVQATADQLQQAYRDRCLQLPRREYSERAIVTRKQLLEEAYTILSNPEDRQMYDAGFLAKTYQFDHDSLPGVTDSPVLLTDPWHDEVPDPHTPSIEIHEEQFPGALLLLQELGEYELVLKLARPYLTPDHLSIQEGLFGDPQFALPDILLSISLAYLELGREQWQQGQYENAGCSLETGQNLLLRETLFPGLRGEMQADLYKLRPYRVMELLSLPLDKTKERRQGLKILREMLQERGGIDGTGDDHSGLNVEDFLRFIQQLRKYLTTGEQQTLFEAEARRPSAVATYLSVYTLMAQGFANREPALVLRAKLLLMQLGHRQDVHLEKAVCSLLLGQTDEASRSLELSQELEPIAFIRDNSKDSPDLLPGLCLYAEHWLQEEVFPHFLDLIQTKASLKEYFADGQVQTYLEALPAEGEGSNQWLVVEPSAGVNTRLQSESLSLGTTPSLSPLTTLSTATIPALSASTSEVKSERVGIPVRAKSPALPSGDGESRRLSLRERRRGSSSKPEERENILEEKDPGVLARHRLTRKQPSLVGNLPDQAPRWLLLGAGVLLFLTMIWSLLAWVGRTIDQLSGPRLTGEQAFINLDTPPLEIPEPKPPEPQLTGTLTDGVGGKVVEQWLAAKRAALGKERDTTSLKGILVDPALSQWLQRAENQKRNNTYQRYEHTVKVESVKVNEGDPNQGQVEVEVREKAELIDREQMINSRDDTLRIRYDLIRKEGKWFIRDWSVLRS